MLTTARNTTIRWGLLVFLFNKDIRSLASSGFMLRRDFKAAWELNKDTDGIRACLGEQRVKEIAEILAIKAAVASAPPAAAGADAALAAAGADGALAAADGEEGDFGDEGDKEEEGDEALEHPKKRARSQAPKAPAAKGHGRGRGRRRGRARK